MNIRMIDTTTGEVVSSIDYSTFFAVVGQALTALDLSTAPEGVFKAHAKKDKDGAKIDGETDGYFVKLAGRLPGVTEMHVADGKIYSKSVQVDVSAFKVQESPYATAATPKAQTQTLSFDAIKAKLASK